MEASLQADAIMPFPTLTSFLIKCFFFHASTTVFCSQYSMSVSCSFYFGLSCLLSASITCSYLCRVEAQRDSHREVRTCTKDRRPCSPGTSCWCYQPCVPVSWLWPKPNLLEFNLTKNKNLFKQDTPCLSPSPPNSYDFFVLPLA